MKILQVNFYDMFSTGNIMLNIARVARERGYEAYTASKKMKMSIERKRNDPYHIYVGTRTENTLHRYFSWITDLQDCGSVIGTLNFIRRIERINPDIIHLHDILGWYLNIDILFAYLKKKKIPVVWTFHDCWAFTGRCIYFDAVGCQRWKTGCGNCPQIDYMPKSWYFDLSAWNFRHKKRLFSDLTNLVVVTPSEWLQRLVKESFFSPYDIRVINNGIDLNKFRPVESFIYKNLRSTQKKIILGVAAPWSKRKGIDTFERLANDLPKHFMIVLVGATEQVISNSSRICIIPSTHDQLELAEIYTAADVFANPTIEDNFPTVNLEALACGTPIVTYRTGGSPEAVDTATGIVVEKNDYPAFLQAVLEVASYGKEHYMDACIERAKRYEMNARFDDYVDLYEEIVKDENRNCHS